MTKAEIWQQHISAWQKSGLSQLAFCKQHDIKQHNLQYWRKRLAAPVDKPKTLIPVTIARTAPARLLLGSQVAIELPAENLPDLLLALRDRGLLHAST
jgi:hypothetical protein